MSVVPLKAGTVADFDNSMAAAMEEALKSAWQTVKGSPLPDAGQEDRRLLFVAIAQGVMRYLEANQGRVINSITFIDALSNTTTHRVSDLDLNFG